MSEPAIPEVVLPTPEPVAPEPVAESAAEPITAAAEPAAEPEPEPEPVVEAAPDKKRPTMLEELIAERTLRKQAETRLRQAEPMLQRLTPEIQQAIQEGRLNIQPPQSNHDLEQKRLEQVANDLGLFKADNTPDLDAARRVDKYVRGTVQQAIAPVRQMTLADKAHQNVSLAISHAQASGIPVEIVQQTYNEILAQPNGAEMLSQPEVATTVWYQALGRAAAAGKLSPAAAKVPATTPPAVIVADPAGRRAPNNAITLSPQLEKIYRDHGMDPKAAATKIPTVDPSGHMELK